jgi:ribosomal-protein-serine acetyltransferase
MTRACRFLVDHAFDEPKLNRVQIRCAVGNTKSQAIPERLGFTNEGTLRQAGRLYGRFVDIVIYSTLADEWQRLRRR